MSDPWDLRMSVTVHNSGQLTENPVLREVGAEYGSALPRIKDNKTIGVADEDAPEESRGQQSIFLGC